MSTALIVILVVVAVIAITILMRPSGPRVTTITRERTDDHEGRD